MKIAISVLLLFVPSDNVVGQSGHALEENNSPPIRFTKQKITFGSVRLAPGKHVAALVVNSF